MNKEMVDERVYKQEMKYRYIASRLIQDVFSAFTLTIKYTPILCGVDVRFTATTKTGKIVTYDVEVKERNKTREKIIQYPTSEIKETKFKSMKDDHFNDKLIYIQFINSKWAMVYDLDELDLENNYTPIDWTIKKTQYDDDSEYIIVPTYFIPYKKKKLKYNSTQYFIDYNAIHQQKHK